MQSSSVAPSTALEYGVLYEKIVDWELLNFGSVPVNETDMIWVLTKMFDEWFLEGESLATARKALAALCFYRPHFGRGAGCQLNGARQA